MQPKAATKQNSSSQLSNKVKQNKKLSNSIEGRKKKRGKTRWEKYKTNSKIMNLSLPR